MQMKILLLGANGQLGRQLSIELLTLGPVKALTRSQADLSVPLHLRDALERATSVFVPDVIVNAAAYTAVDKAETDVHQAMAVNAQSVEVLAEFAQSLGASFVHYSSDYVFDGSGNRPWTETDDESPLSCYGMSKYLGEKAIAKVCAKYLVLRTSWLVGEHGNNFLKTVLRLATERDTLQVVSDQVGVPTTTHLLTNATIELLRLMQFSSSLDQRWGIYHVVPSGETTWHGYASYVLEAALNRGMKLKAKAKDVRPIRTDEYPLPASRPLNSRLCTKKIQQIFGLKMPIWQDDLEIVIDELLGHLPN